jgi:hypothetical protein
MKKGKSLEEWENSLEEIHDSLKLMGDINFEDMQHNSLICQVLLNLPKEVREKVLDEVFFVHTTAWGTVRRVHFHKFIEEKEAKKIEGNGFIKSGFDVTIPQVFIILNLKCIRKDETKKDTIAHEIAHFILDSKDPDKSSPSDKAERDADDLAEKWGFNRGYKSYKGFKGACSGMG